MLRAAGYTEKCRDKSDTEQRRSSRAAIELQQTTESFVADDVASRFGGRFKFQYQLVVQTLMRSLLMVVLQELFGGKIQRRFDEKRVGSLKGKMGNVPSAWITAYWHSQAWFSFFGSRQ